MTHDWLVNRDWQLIVERLGGPAALEASARGSKALQRARVVANAADLLRLILAYCLSERGLRSTAAWASAIGLVDISNVALLYRLRRCGDWLAALVGQVLASAAPAASHGRLIRLVDATSVPQAGAAAKQRNRVWRIHAAFDLPSERFGCFELTDQHGGERLDRIAVIKGEIRIGDRAYLRSDQIADVLAAGADIVVRAGWKSARWLDASGKRVGLVAMFAEAAGGRIDRPIRLERKNGPPLALRLVAIRKPVSAASESRRKARREAQREGSQISQATLAAADWVSLITSLDADTFTADDILPSYRLRWRIELGFKRLKSLIGLHGPPGINERSARPYVLAHLLAILLLEPLVDALEDSPRSAVGV